MAFTPKSFPEIVASMAAKVAAETPITDFNPGSVILTLLEAPAQEDFQQYVAMLEIILNYNLDTTTGDDLEARASEYGLTRLPARTHSGFIAVIDTRFEKISTKIYSGLPGPTAGSNVIRVDDASELPATGSVYVGRGSANAESIISYSTPPVDNGFYWTLTLDTNLTKDHGTDETVILAQFGDRTIDAGTEVRIPPNDFSEAIVFELNQAITLLDGENRVDNVLVTALRSGGFVVPADSIIEFVNSPFDGAVVTNPLPFVNGRDEESDAELRDRIRDTVQSLSRGTPRSIRTNINGIIDPVTNSSIISSKVVPPVLLADGPTKVYINNGRGLEPELDSVGHEILTAKATGGEVFFQSQQFPLIKANVISQLGEPFNLTGGETLIVSVGNLEEVFTFANTDFRVSGKATAVEVAEAINNRSELFEARTITVDTLKCIAITPLARVNEDLQIDESSTAQSVFNFNTKRVFTAKPYKNDKLISKDGVTASILSDAQPFDLSISTVTSSDGDFTVTAGSRVVTKATSGTGNDAVLEQVHPGGYIKLSTESDDFYTQVQTVVDGQKFILKEPYPGVGGTGNITIWNSPQLEIAANGDRYNTELVSFGPNDFADSSQALASEILERLEKDVQQSKSELAVNSTRVRIISNIENSSKSKMQILGGAAAVELGLSTVSTLTGTATFVGGSTVVSGSGTKFLTELKEGQWIKASAHDKGSWTRVETIESDDTLYLREGYRGPGVSSAVSAMSESELVEGKDREYIMNFSNGMIELAEPLQAGDTLTLGSINTRAFVDSLGETFDFDSLGVSSSLVVRIDGGFKATVTSEDEIAPYDQFSASSLASYGEDFFAGFHLEWTSGNNIGETDFVSDYDPSTGQLILLNGATASIGTGDKFVLSQVITFDHSDFTDAENVTAEEVVDIINAQILGGSSSKQESTNSVRIQTSNFAGVGAIKIVGGSANQILSFSTEEQFNQEPNLGFVTSEKSDREGLSDFLGFTLGPDQSLVVLIDDDSVNKTFLVPAAITGTVSSSASGSAFTSSDIQEIYTTSDFFNDFWVYWKSGSLEGKVQTVTAYNGTTGEFTVDDVYPSTVGQASEGDEFALVPRTAENLKAHLENLNITTLSTAADIAVTGISGDNVQITTKTPGSKGKVLVSGGTANSIQIPIVSVVAGSPTNDFTVNSKAGLSKGLPVNLRVSGKVTTADNEDPKTEFISSSFITSLEDYFEGLTLTFTSGLNAGLSTTIEAYEYATGEFTVSEMPNDISVDDTFDIDREAVVSDIQGSVSPYTIAVTDLDASPIDVSGYTVDRNGQIKDLNGLNFSTTQVEGIDGYKHYVGLVRLAQWTIDGLDRDASNYPGLGASGTQFEVIPPKLKNIKLTLDVTTDPGVNLSSLLNEISSVVLGYINSREVGEDVILSEIIAAAQSVDGVFDVKIMDHTDNIIVKDGEQAFINSSDLVIG